MEALLVLGWIAIAAGLSMTAFFSIRLSQSLKSLNKSIEAERASRNRLTNLMLDYIEHQAAAIKNLDVNNMFTEFHEVPEELKELRTP